MRWSLRFALSASALAAILLVLLKGKIEDIWDQYSVGDYIQSSWNNELGYEKAHSSPAQASDVGDKVIIMAKLEKEDTDWVGQHLSEYVPNSSTLAFS